MSGCELEACDVEGDHRHRPHEWAAAGYCPGPQHRGQRPAGFPTWCEGHVARVAGSLRELPRYAADIPGWYARRTAGASERSGKVGKRAHAPSPSSDVDALDEIARWHYRWAVDAAAFLGHAGPDMDTAFGIPDVGAATVRGSRYLQAQWPQLAPQAADVWPIAFGLSAMTLAGRMELWLHQDDPVNRLYAPCPVCAGRRLRRRNGASQVDCPDCQASWPEEHYELLARMTAEDHAPPRRRRGVVGTSS